MSGARFPNESAEYRKSRSRLLEAEIALRGQLEEVAAARRQLPLGGTVKEDYVFDEVDDQGSFAQVELSQLFGSGKDSLFLYGYMFGPSAAKVCPMCTSFLDALNAQAQDLSQQIKVAVVARAPIEELAAFGAGRGWQDLRLLSSVNNTYQVDYLAEDSQGNQWPMANVFVRRDGAIHHYWGSELLFEKNPDGDPRHIDLLWPLWNVLDLTPEGRREKWYPSLVYDE